MISERTIFACRVTAIAVCALLFLVIALVPLIARGDVPDAARPWRRDLVRESRLAWGLDAPIATFAAQIETESAFRANARSSVGALGIAQFMPATATWLVGAYPALGPSDPLNPRWALRALATYDRHLWQRQIAATDCDRAAFMEAAYNGGEAALTREQDACLVVRCDPTRWWDNVERQRARSLSAWTENRNYPKRIRAREPIYATWGAGLCST